LLPGSVDRGLICTEIFGYKNEGAKEYAINLGIAMQLTNILRDIKTDAAKEDLLPLEDLTEFGYTEEDYWRGRTIRNSSV